MEPLGLRSQDFFSTLWEDYMTLLPLRPVPVVFDEYIRFGSALPTREVPQLALCVSDRYDLIVHSTTMH